MSFKVYEGNILEKVGINRQIIGAGIGSAIEGVANGAYGTLQSAWDEDYTSFQRGAAGLSEGFRGVVDVSVGLGFGIAAHRTLPGNGEYMWEALSFRPSPFEQKGVWALRESGGYAALNAKAMSLDGYMSTEALKKVGKEGFWKQTSSVLNSEGKFMKRPFILTGPGAVVTIAASVLLPWGVEKTLGLAGKMLDESHLAYSQAKYHTYDTRQFNTRSLQAWNMAAQESAMSQLVPFESNMMSIARLYHV